MLKKLNKFIAGTATAAGTYLTTASVVLAQATEEVTGTGKYAITKPKGFFTNFGSLITGALRIVLVIGALLVFAYLVIGGIEYITSGGEKGRTEAARNKITSAIIGLIILAASYALLTLSLNFLGFNDINEVLQQNLPGG